MASICWFFIHGTQWWFVLLAVASGFCFFWLQTLSRRLRTEVAPLGMVSLQLANSGASSREVVASWGNPERDSAERSLCLDYAFIPLYTTALALLSIMARARFRGSRYVQHGQRRNRCRVGTMGASPCSTSPKTAPSYGPSKSIPISPMALLGWPVGVPD